MEISSFYGTKNGLKGVKMKYTILGILCITIGVLAMIVNDMDATYLVLMSIFGIGLIFGSRWFDEEEP